MPSKIILYYNDIVYQPSESFLFKDFGQVPYVLSQIYDTDLEYWISANRLNPALDKFRGKPVRQFGKHFRRIPSRFDAIRNISLYSAIARDRDVTHLMVFPFTPVGDLIAVKKAKINHPTICVIVKLDTNRDFLNKIAEDWQICRKSPLRFIRQSWHYRELLRIADVVLCETVDCEHILRNGFLGLNLNEKIARTFSGVSQSWLRSMDVHSVPEERRRKSIVVSGRISSWQKDTALILEARPPSGWTIEFIGEVDEQLSATISMQKARNPLFDEQFRFYGMITDKRRYFDILVNSQALLMNSRGGEGFPNVFAEAHACGLSIITSDVSGASDATDGGRWGQVYPVGDLAALRAALQALPERIVRERNDPELSRYRQNFVWEYSLDQPAIRRVFNVADSNESKRSYTI